MMMHELRRQVPNAKALEYRCPYCGAESGDPCYGRPGNGVRKAPHPVRKDQALRLR